MKLYLKQKVFSFRDRFTARCETGEDRFYVEGRVFTLGKQLYVYDASGNEVAYIRQKLMSWMPRFTIEIGGKEVCTIIQKFQFLKNDYRIEGLPWYLEGDFVGHEYELINDNQVIMRLSKHWFTWGDSYELDICEQTSDPDFQELLCLCIALAVDAAMCVQRRG